MCASLRRWDWRSAALLGLMMAGAISTKYQAIYLCVPPTLASLWLLGVKVVRARARPASAPRLALPPAVLAVVVLVGTSPLWLKNWLWYGNPVYPMLQARFDSHPWAPGTNPDKYLELAAWTPQGTLLDKIRETFLATFTFSFKPHDWWNLHADLPVFGSLFTLVLPLILFIPRRRRLVGLAVATWAGLFVWYWTYHQDRYLQAILPWMAALVGVTLAAIWARGWTGRLAAALLVSAQIVWGGDTYAIPTHAMIGQVPAKATLDLISSGYRKEWSVHRDSTQQFEPVGRALPPHSKVLVHEIMTHLGLAAMSVNDLSGTQGGISYVALADPEHVLDRFRRYGVTHVLWRSGVTTGWQSVAEDLVFFEFVTRYLTNPLPVAGWNLARLERSRAPFVPANRLVRIEACDSTSRTVELGHLDAALAGEAIARADEAGGPPAFWIVQAGCATLPAEHRARYEMVAVHTPYELWVAREP
jgi:hypothetical protein